MPQLTVATIVMKDSASVLIGRAKDGPDAGMWVIPSDFVAEGEQVMRASERSVSQEAGITVRPKQVLFVSEIVEPGDHRVAVFCYAEWVSGDPVPGGSLSEARWADPREIGEYQKEGMSLLTADAFYKFSRVLAAQAQVAREAAAPQGPPN